MWIFLGIIAFILLLITAILLLPVYVIIKTDETGEVIFRYKILFKTYGENPNPDNPIVKALVKTSGLERLRKEQFKESAMRGTVLDALGENVSLILGLLKHLLGLLKRCKVKVLKLNVICAEGDAAETAIYYGQSCALVYPLVSFIHASLKVRKKGEKVAIICDYDGQESYYELETILVVRVFRVLGAVLRAGIDEAKRMAQEDAANQRNSRSAP